MNHRQQNPKLSGIHHLLAAAFCVITLAACVTKKERIARYVEKCKQYGFKPETEAMANCVMKLDTTKDINISVPAAKKPQCTTIYTTTQGYHTVCY